MQATYNASVSYGWYMSGSLLGINYFKNVWLNTALSICLKFCLIIVGCWWNRPYLVSILTSSIIILAFSASETVWLCWHFTGSGKGLASLGIFRGIVIAFCVLDLINSFLTVSSKTGSSVGSRVIFWFWTTCSFMWSVVFLEIFLTFGVALFEYELAFLEQNGFNCNILDGFVLSGQTLGCNLCFWNDGKI